MFVPVPAKYIQATVLSSAMSEAPNLLKRMCALFVMVWLADQAALVTVIASSKVNTKSNKPVSATTPAV